MLPKPKTAGMSRYVGRVGALAVALGVGAAVASIPAVAVADSTGSAVSTESSSAGEGSSPTATASDGASSEPGDSLAGSGSDVEPSDVEPADVEAADVEAPDVESVDVDSSDVEPSDIGVVDTQDADNPPGWVAAAGVAASDASPAEDTGELPESSVSEEGEISAADLTEFADDGTPPGGPVPAAVSSGDSTDAGTADAIAAVPGTSAGASDGVAAATALGSGPIAQGSGSSGGDAPAAALGLATLGGAARRETESRVLPVAFQQGVTELVDPPAPAVPADKNILVIGLDGTRLSAILDDPANVNLFALMAGGDIVTPGGTTTIVGGTTAASTIVGHTTISLPSWTTILGGVWSEVAGVINNVYYPKTANAYPTTFNTLEAAYGDNIQTMAIANWFGTAAISDAESHGLPGADVVQYVEDYEDDPLWTQSDNRVAELTVQAILGTNPGCGGPCPVPDFLFSYFVGVDETGHAFGGGSPEYAEALRNVDQNVGQIMEAVLASGEDWTVIVVTDHGQSTMRGDIGFLAHGFQSPEETTTFVIAWDGENASPVYEPGAMNNQYSILDISPTVLDHFGGSDLLPDWYQGVPLSAHDASTVKPADPLNLRVALLDAIGMYGYPDIITNLSLSIRTIFAIGPMLIYDFTNTIIAAVEEILPSPLAAFVTVPIRVIGDLLYTTTNVPAQIVAKLTGVTGASIFPLLPPDEPELPPAPPGSPDLLASLVSEPGDPLRCGDDGVSTDFAWSAVNQDCAG